MSRASDDQRGWRAFGRRRPEDKPEGEPPFDVEASIPNGVRLAGGWSWRLLLIGAVIAVVIFLVIQLRLIVIPLFVAVLLAALLVPFVGFLRRHRWPAWLAITVAMLGTLVLVAGLLVLVITQIQRGASDIASHALESFDELKAWLLASPFEISESDLNGFLNQAWASIQQDSQVYVTGALSLGSSLGHLVAGVFLTLFSLLFILIDGGGIWRWIVSLFPKRARAAVDGAAIAGWTTLTNFARVQVLVAAIDAVGIGLGAFLLGVPLAIPIAVLVFLGSFIPIVGAVVTGTLAAAIALVYNGPWIALWMIVVVLAVQQLEGHVLQPLIVGSVVKVHPLAVVLVVATGSLLAGIPGALFAVPVAAVMNVMVRYISSGVWKTRPPVEPPVPQSILWQTVPQPRPGYRKDDTTDA
ncbi:MULTISPECIES: AI-2E family transporter [unclassified Leifsonia]|uniref:AI-2E family transporter n=1 Tax=unclassified Leifsonia TaxID=2663824 RepID=UPI0006FA32D4|nr:MULTISPECIES: AI-2E family transporter [unclassified Leifsonia]KQX07462.1 permease [Leifsonia sp. Root1293]KRA11744.1 permease [Leifsonia sp. Root60]